MADQWIAYLRHGLSTCYYCVAPSPFQEELHRKCIGHVRPDSSKYTESETAQTSDEAKPAVEGGDEDSDARHVEDREFRPSAKVKFPQKTGDEKWEGNLDTKIKPLIGEYDLAEYGGRDLQEWVFLIATTRLSTADLVTGKPRRSRRRTSDRKNPQSTAAKSATSSSGRPSLSSSTSPPNIPKSLATSSTT